MQCHTIKIVQKLDIYERFKNDRSISLDNSTWNICWQHVTTDISFVQNNFIKNLFTVKSRDCRSLFDRLQTSRLYNNTGMYFDLSNCMIRFTWCNSPQELPADSRCMQYSSRQAPSEPCLQSHPHSSHTMQTNGLVYISNSFVKWIK